MSEEVCGWKRWKARSRYEGGRVVGPEILAGLLGGTESLFSPVVMSSQRHTLDA